MGSNGDERFSTRKSCSNLRLSLRTEKISVLSRSSHETQISKPIKKRPRSDKSTECFCEGLSEDIEHDILSRLNIRDLLRARLTCHAWHDSISSSHIFQLLYDQRNRESWIAVTSDPLNPNKFCLVNNNPSKWYYIKGFYHWDLTKSWLLLGAPGGLMLHKH